MNRDYSSEELRHFSWWASEAKLKAFSATGKGGKSVIKIEIEVVDPSALGSLMRALQEASAPPKPKTAAPDTRPALPGRRLALPAPRLQLTDGRPS